MQKASTKGIVLSSLEECATLKDPRETKAQQWKKENKEAIAAYNRHIDEFGVFGDGLRTF